MLRLLFGVGTLMVVFAGGVLVANIESTPSTRTPLDPVARSNVPGAKSMVPAKALTTKVVSGDLEAQNTAIKFAPKKRQAEPRVNSAQDSFVKSVAMAIAAKKAREKKKQANTTNVANASLLDMIQQCHDSIWEAMPPTGKDLETTVDTFDVNDPKPFSGYTFSTTDRTREVSYLNLNSKSPLGDKRSCTVNVKNLEELSKGSFYPQFKEWWENQPNLSTFVALETSQDAYSHDRDVIHQWHSRQENARNCEITVVYAERYEEEALKLTVFFGEREESCVQDGSAQTVLLNRLPQVSD